MKPVPRIAVALSLVVALLVLFSAGSGALWWEDVYPLEQESAATQAQAQDIVTVLLVLPLFLLSLLAAARGSLRGRLAWIGILAYFTYTYLSYSVGTPFNDFFHFYVAAYSLSLISLVIGVATLDLRAIREAAAEGTPRRLIGGFSVVVGAGLMAAWLGETVPMVLFDQSSNLLMEQASPALFIQALDLALVVPLGLVGGVLLWRDSRVGYLLASIFLMKAVTLFTAVFAMALLMLARDVGGSVGEVAATGTADIAGILLAAVFFLRMRGPLQHPTA